MNSPNDARRIYYLSPHADDVAFSCPGSVISDVAEAQVTLITVFLSGKTAPIRQAEDERAAQVLGCRYRCLDLFDAPDRPEIVGPFGLFSPYSPAHLGVTSEVVARLRTHIKAPALLVAPLAVGAHIDHRIVHEAARALAYGQGLDLAYFEDLPYALAPGALARRLAALETTIPNEPGTSRLPRGAECKGVRDLWRSFPLMRRYPPVMRFAACHLLARAVCAADKLSPFVGKKPVLVPWLRKVTVSRSVRLQAVAAYASQWPLFARSVEQLVGSYIVYGRTLRPTVPDELTYERLWLDQAFGSEKTTS